MHDHPPSSLYRSYDISLVRMALPIRYSPLTAPICLPSSTTTELFESVFVAGWGALRAKNDIIETCSTTQYGPAKFKECVNFDKKTK